MSEKNLLVASDNGKNISLTINDTLDLLVKSPMVTQIFAKAVVNYVTNLVTGTITEVVVSIDAALNRMDYEVYRHKLVLNISKLETATKLCAQAVVNAESDPNIPADMRQELVDRLYGLFYSEMEKLAPRGR